MKQSKSQPKMQDNKSGQSDKLNKSERTESLQACPMDYSDNLALEAWKTFVSTGEILEGKVRPEIAASWLRCMAQGLDPWSTNFRSKNTTLLNEKRERFSASLRATVPVMNFLKSLLGANVSLMDGENFVFELFSPLTLYPRTCGTYMHEKDVGTGNATLVAVERKPVRVDGFEHYRTIAQSYSGVSAPYLDAQGRYFGAMNINSPFRNLPPCSLDLCIQGVKLTEELHAAGDQVHLLLLSTSFFNPLLEIYAKPVVLTDMQGRILNVNSAMRAYCPDWDEYSHGTQSLDAYLGKSMTFNEVLKRAEGMNRPVGIPFRKGGKSRSAVELPLVRCDKVKIDRVDSFMVFAFDQEDASADKASDKRMSVLRDTAVISKESKTDYVGESAVWTRIDNLVNKAAPVRTHVLLLGETGTGKEVVARAIHRRSGRKGPFVAVNCGALPRDLLATELFGYEGGAFTGAREEGAVGKFEFAHEGTLFLDEIGEMPVDMQVSLLRVLQESAVTKLGSNTTKQLDLRVVAATNQDIQRLILEKTFRKDLYYRLSMIEIHLPQLRTRVDDIPLLIDYFNELLAVQLNAPVSPFPSETVQALCSYSWPGNVRELRNVVERCLILEGEGANVSIDALPYYIANASGAGGGPMAAFAEAPTILQPAATVLSEEQERALIKQELRACEGDMSLAVARLGIDYNELREKMTRLGIKPHFVFEDEV